MPHIYTQPVILENAVKYDVNINKYAFPRWTIGLLSQSDNVWPEQSKYFLTNTSCAPLSIKQLQTVTQALKNKLVFLYIDFYQRVDWLIKDVFLQRGVNHRFVVTCCQRRWVMTQHKGWRLALRFQRYMTFEVNTATVHVHLCLCQRVLERSSRDHVLGVYFYKENGFKYCILNHNHGDKLQQRLAPRRVSFGGIPSFLGMIPAPVSWLVRVVTGATNQHGGGIGAGDRVTGGHRGHVADGRG